MTAGGFRSGLTSNDRAIWSAGRPHSPRAGGANRNCLPPAAVTLHSTPYCRRMGVVSHEQRWVTSGESRLDTGQRQCPRRRAAQGKGASAQAYPALEQGEVHAIRCRLHDAGLTCPGPSRAPASGPACIAEPFIVCRRSKSLQSRSGQVSRN